MLLFSSILLALWVIVLAALIEHTLNHGVETDQPFLSCTGMRGWIQAVSVGLTVGLANYLSPKGGGWTITSLILIIVVMVYVAIWFFKDTDEWKEWFLFVLMLAPMAWTVRAVGVAASTLVQSELWASVLNILPWCLYTALHGFLLVSLLFAKYETAEKDREAENYRILGCIVAVLTVLIVCLELIFGITWKSSAGDSGKTTTKAKATVTATTATTEKTGWWYFYNTAMIDTDEDNNFGSNPVDEVLAQKVSAKELTFKEISGKSEDELMSLVTVAEIEKNFRERVSNDPALGAADMAWFDAILKTRYLGEFYEECKQEWASTMNLAKVRWMEDQKAYNQTLAAWFSFLDTAKKVEVVKVTGGLDDQMYMNPYTVDWIPDIIVMETDDHDGYFLRFTFSIKGKEVTVAYRIDCGYQPTNVSIVMKITPQPKPKPKPKPEPKTEEPPTEEPPTEEPPTEEPPTEEPPTEEPPTEEPPTEEPPTEEPPTEEPPTEAPPKKDPTKGTKVGENDTPGPGPNTNNGKGSQYSKEEKPTNSAFDTYEEYKEKMKENKETAENQKVGGDSNTPSTPLPTKDTKVDSNADKGTGNGGVDTPTPVHETHVESDTGGSTKTSDDPNGDAWGGPPD